MQNLGCVGQISFLRLHDYSENIKSRTTVFIVKGKVDIWWEYVNNFIVIQEEELIRVNLKNF